MFPFADEGSFKYSGGIAEATAEYPVPQLAEQPQPVRETRNKPIAITGAAGFVGTHVCKALSQAGWKIRALVRDPVKAAARLADFPVELKVGDIRDAEFVQSAFEGVEAVVHLAAIAIERGKDTYEQINTEATRVVLEAAQNAGVTRFLHMSQNGSDSASSYRFLRSKGVAQDLVTASSLRWTVFRPSVIFGPEDEFVNVLARLVRLSPLVFPLPDGGKARFQPIYVDDVAAAVRNALDNDATIGHMYPIGGPIPLSLYQMAERILTAMQTHRTIVGVPAAVLKPLVAMAERVLPKPPVTSGLLDLLKIDNTIPDNTIVTTFGITPTPFAPEELLYLRRITFEDALRGVLGR